MLWWIVGGVAVVLLLVVGALAWLGDKIFKAKTRPTDGRRL